MILAGGRGTRLQRAVPNLPKVLAPVCGRPFLAYLLDRLAAASLERVILLTGYRGEEVEQAFGKRWRGLRIEYSRESVPLGTGGSVRHALNRLDSATILLLNGDSYCDADLQTLCTAHRRRRADLSMVLAPASDASRYGKVCRDATNRITGYVEKVASAGSGWINAGIYVIERDLLDEMPAGRALSLENEWLPHWIATRKVIGVPTRGRFLDIGTPESYGSAEAFFTRTRRREVPAFAGATGW